MKGLFFFLVLAPFFGLSQHVRVNVYDKFLKKHRIELEPVTVSLPQQSKLNIGFTSIADSLFVQLSGTGWGASTIDYGNEVILLFSNDSTVTIKSTAVQSFEPGSRQNTYSHQYYIEMKGVQALSKYDLVGMRKYNFRDFSDITIPKGSRSEIKSRSSLFLSELSKLKGGRSTQNTAPSPGLTPLAENTASLFSYCKNISTESPALFVNKKNTTEVETKYVFFTYFVRGFNYPHSVLDLVPILMSYPEWSQKNTTEPVV